MEHPNNEPQKISLENLEKEYYRLQFLVDLKNENVKREEELSLKAGVLVGKLYDALIKEYIDPDDNSFRSLNILCVRIVFCLYAEDAGLFETKTSFEDYIKSFSLENLRDGIIKLFKALDTRLEQRDKYDTKLKPFPYVNGGLFCDEQIEIPNFTEEIVNVIVNHCAPFDWRDISPTIFGAVFESTLSPALFEKKQLEISFAWRTFVWNSDSTDKAHVHCVIIGFNCYSSDSTKHIYNEDGTCTVAHNINGYLLLSKTGANQSMKTS